MLYRCVVLFQCFDSKCITTSHKCTIAGHGLPALFTVNAVHYIIGFTYLSQGRSSHSLRNVYTLPFLVSVDPGSESIEPGLEITWDVVDDGSVSEHWS